MIRFSVITVTYNAEAVLGRTLESVLCQTYDHVEHLIIDGASTDGTLHMADVYKQQSDTADNGHRVTILSEPDRGIYDAMNKGLTQAGGDYVVFMNAGDSFPQVDILEQIVRSCKLDEYPPTELPGVLYGDTNIVDGKGRFLHRRRLIPPENLTWQSFRQGMLVCHQAFYARTDFAVQTPYNTTFRYSADVDWCIRVMKEAEREQVPLVNLHMVVANYTEEGQTTQHHRESLLERYRIMQRHYGILQTFFLHCWFVVRQLLR